MWGVLWAHGFEQFEGGHSPQHVIAKEVLTENFFVKGFFNVFGGVGGGLSQLGEERQGAQTNDAAGCSEGEGQGSREEGREGNEMRA